MVIADEAHRLKEPRGQLGLAMKRIQCPSCFALTGTLIQNRLEEMWSVLDFVSGPYIWSLKSQVQRGHAGTLKQWRGFVVNPIKQGQRREGMATDVVRSIVSDLSWLLQGAVNSIVALGSHAPGYSTAFCPQEDEKAHRRRGRS